MTCTIHHCIPLAHPLTDSNDGVLWAPVICRRANHGPRTYIGLTGKEPPRFQLLFPPGS